MGLPSRRSLAEARIALGSFDRFLLLYGAMFAAFGVASPFLPALLHERGLGPSEIGAVLAAGTAVRLITGPVISRLADRLGKHRQTLAVLLAMAAIIAFGYSLVWGIVCQARFIKSLLLTSSFHLVNSDVPRGALHDQRGSSRRILVCG